MLGKIIEINTEASSEIVKSLRLTKELINYRYIFSGREWIQSYCHIYKPKNIVLITSACELLNYAVFVRNGSNLMFLGDPFNDFNGFYNIKNDQVAYYKPLLDYVKKNHLTLRLNSLFEEDVSSHFLNHATSKSRTNSLHIEPKNHQFVPLVSERISKMYYKGKESGLTFGREYLGIKTDQGKRLLSWLLDKRHNKLNSRKVEEMNDSFHKEFNNLIYQFCFTDTLKEHVYIDYCFDSSRLVACSLNLTHKHDSICYLRAHEQGSNDVSYGLILDFWSGLRNEREKYNIMDFTRGNEPYKYRLGAQEYYLQNIII